MPKQPSLEAKSLATTFLHELWSGLRPHAEQTLEHLQQRGTDEQVLQTKLALALLREAENLSVELVRRPETLEIAEANIMRSTRRLDLPSISSGEPPTTIPVKYSTVTATVERKPKAKRLPRDPNNALAQVLVELTEMFRDSQREVLTVLQEISVSYPDRPGEIGHLSEIEAGLMGIQTRTVGMTEKATWWNQQRRRIWTWNLAGFESSQAASGAVVVRSTVQYGREDTDAEVRLHDLSFDHDALGTGMLGLLGDRDHVGAIEPFVRLVEKKLGKRE